MGDSAGAKPTLPQGKVLVGDKEKENGVGVLIIQHFNAINPISTFRNAKAAARHDCLKQSILPSLGGSD
jgi:hypothetical protein